MQTASASLLVQRRIRQAALSHPPIRAAFRGLAAPQPKQGGTEAEYHADVQQHLVQSFREQGHTVEENIRLTSAAPGPGWTYDADFIMKPVDGSVPCIVEVKTSLTKQGFDDFDGSEFRRKQFQVLVLANLGGHVKTNNLRILNLGLPFGLPLPPLAVMVIYGLPKTEFRPFYVPPGDLADLMKVLQ